MSYDITKGLIYFNLSGASLPLFYIQSGYKSTPNQRQDLNSFVDNFGVLHRNVLQHTRTKIEFNTPPMSLAEKNAFMTFLNGGMSSQLERKANITYYCEDTDSYKTGDFYVPDIEFTSRTVWGGIIEYEPIRIALIEY